MSKNCKHLTHDDRILIARLFNSEKKTVTFIASELHKSRKCISAEINKNLINSNYDVNHAIKNCVINTKKSHDCDIKNYSKFIKYFETNYESKFNGVEVCRHNAISLKIKSPCVATVYS
jgi:IS30 family transposase